MASMTQRILLAVLIVTVDLVLFYIPLTAIVLAYIILFKPDWLWQLLGPPPSRTNQDAGMHAAPSWPTYDRLLRQRRSVRAYEDMAVPKPVLEAIVGESCLAPSSENRQPWRFIVITDRELMRRLSDESKTNLIRRMAEDQEAPAKGYASLLRDPDSNVFYNAPCLVLLAGSGNLRSVHVDCALAAGYLMWAAAARGLGTCLVGLGRAIEDPLLLEHIGLTPHECIVAPIIVGYPQKMPAMPDRRPPRITWVTAQDRPGTE